MTNTTKQFDILVKDSLESVIIRELTLKEREKLFLKFEDAIKTRRRKEYLELAKLIEGKDKNKYLIECANNNIVDQDAIVNEAQTVFGISETLNIAADKKLNWSEILTDNESSIPLLLRAFYFAYGVDVPLEDVPSDKDEDKDKPDEDTPESTEDDKQTNFLDKLQTK